MGFLRDEELMMDYKNTRDPEALVELFRRYQQVMFAYLTRRTGNSTRAEDLTQEVFYALINGASRYRPTGSFKAYLYKIARNLSAKEWRTYRRRVQLTVEPTGTASSHNDLEQKRTAQAVQAALSALDADQRDPIMLREYEGLNYLEISQVLGIPQGTVKSRIARGKMALRKLLLSEAPQGG
jgi:RNA polymerase sigma-70 factor (ECF subfamily)